MNSGENDNQKGEGKEEETGGKKDLIRDWLILLITATGAVILLSFFPGKVEPTISTSMNYLIEMAWILPAVMIL
ncbi:MAG: hypothetical protein ACLFTO_02985, partial [Candidatus Acetothermia bacterium]